MDGFIKDSIKDKLTGHVKDKIAEKLGTNKNDTDNAIDKGLYAILGGLAQNTKNDRRAQDLDDAIKKDHDGSVFNNLGDLLSDGRLSTEGGKILGHVFGSKKDKVVDEMSKETELDGNKSGGLLDMLAPIVLGQLGKEKGVNAGSLNDMFSNEKTGDIMSKVMDFLDKDDDGSVVDDIAGIFKK